MFALGQSQAPAGQAPAQPAPAPPAPSPWSVGPIDFTGLVDGYYGLNFNHPASGFNGLNNGAYVRNFDVKANQFSLNMAELNLAHSADPVGFELDFGFGRAFDIITASEPPGSPNIFHNIRQAYATYKPSKDKNFQLDFGKFVTWAGAEVIETHSNWNYSRSLLFNLAIPYYHFGLRATGTKGHYTGGVAVLNGWNNVEDNNTGKTLGLIGNITTKKVTWTNTYYTGPENTGTTQGFRNLYDTNVLFTPADKFSAYINFDYAQNTSGAGKAKTTAEWFGIAVAPRFQFTGKAAVTPRFEYFKDRDGYTTGAPQILREFTLTYEYKLPEGVLARLEYRRDWSTAKYFERGAGPGLYDHQDTLMLGIVAYFGPKR